MIAERARDDDTRFEAPPTRPLEARQPKEAADRSDRPEVRGRRVGERMHTSIRPNPLRRAAIAAAGWIVLLTTAAASRDLEDILKDKKIIDATEANEAKAAKEKEQAA